MKENNLEDYNIIKFSNVSEMFNWFYDEDYSKEDIIALLTDDMKDKILRNNDNIRKEGNNYYYSSDMDLLEDNLVDLEQEEEVDINE